MIGGGGEAKTRAVPEVPVDTGNTTRSRIRSTGELSGGGIVQEGERFIGTVGKSVLEEAAGDRELGGGGIGGEG